MEITKGGLWSGPFNSNGVDPNTRAQLLDLRWTTTDNGSIFATRIPYAFPTEATDYTVVPGGYPSPSLLVGFEEVSAAQKTAVRFTFDLVSSYTKLKFVEAPSGHAVDAAIRIAHYGQGGSEAYTPHEDGRTSGDAFLGGNATVSAQQIGRTACSRSCTSSATPLASSMATRPSCTARWLRTTTTTNSR